MSTKAKIAAATIAAAMLAAVPFISEREGEKLEAYEDVVGVWTICRGHTEGVIPGMTKTKEECEALTNRTIAQFMTQVANLIDVPVAPPTLAAHTSFAYNIGINAYKRSETRRYTNEGNLLAGCNAMANWYRAGGKDCRIKSNNCRGVVLRRDAEIEMCIRGLK